MKFSVPILSSLFLTAFDLPGTAIAQLTDGNLQQPASFSNNGGDLTVDLALVEGAHSTVAAQIFNTRMLGGTLPGPTIRVRKGEWLFVNFDNNMAPQNGINTAANEYGHPDSTNLHFHGAHVSGERPGDDTTIIVDAGESFNYEVFFPSFHMGGTNWIHPHRHGSGTLQVGGGASMALIVEDAPGEVPPEVANAEEVIMVVQHFDNNRMEQVTNESGDDVFVLTRSNGVGNDFRLVNGQYRPTVVITAGDWQRWRVIFASWDRNPLDLSMQTNGVCEFHLLAKDGIYINDYPRTLDFYPISTAGRADIMVRCSGTGSWTVNDYGGALLTINSVSPPGGNGAIDVSTPPTSNFNFPIPSYLNDLRGRSPSPGCACNTALFQNSVNGIRYDANAFVHTVAQGSLVERTLQGVNNHPYHQHVYPFQIQQFFGITGDDAEYHKVGDYHDTLMVRTSSTVRVTYEANNFLGRMAVHCHRLTHSDQGMISAEDVIDPARGGTCNCDAVEYTRAPVAPPTDAPEPPTDAPVAPPTDAPVAPPTDAPVAPPTDAPVPPPTDAPIDPPSGDCVDSPFKAIIKRKSIDCGSFGCTKKKEWSHCKLFCDKCNKCVDSGSKFKFRSPDTNKNVRKTCKQIKSTFSQYCQSVPGIAETCPKTCGLC